MKKIFTLISMALVAMSVNAQTESYVGIDDSGNPAEEFTIGAQWEGTDLVMTKSTGHASMRGLSSKTPKDIESTEEGLSFTKETWPEEWWNEAVWEKANKNKEIWHYDTDGTTKIHDFQFYSVWGKGNPVTGWVSEPVMTEGDFAGKYKPVYDGYYFVPGESTSVPVSGEYFEFTADVDGMFKIGFYTPNGANRYMYIVDKEEVRTLSKSEYKVEGYVNGCDNKDGSPMFISSIQVNDDYSIGNTAFTECYSYGTKCDGIETYEENGETKTRQPVNQLTQPKYGWFVFDAKAGKTYMIFGPNYQFGFRSYEFTPNAKIDDYTPSDPTAIESIKTVAANANAPLFNLAGQKVSKSYKGVVIQNGKKMVLK